MKLGKAGKGEIRDGVGEKERASWGEIFLLSEVSGKRKTEYQNEYIKEHN